MRGQRAFGPSTTLARSARLTIFWYENFDCRVVYLSVKQEEPLPLMTFCDTETSPWMINCVLSYQTVGLLHCHSVPRTWVTWFEILFPLCSYIQAKSDVFAASRFTLEMNPSLRPLWQGASQVDERIWVSSVNLKWLCCHPLQTTPRSATGRKACDGSTRDAGGLKKDAEVSIGSGDHLRTPSITRPSKKRQI